ncbi:MAG TPA: hypothetical protein ENL10_02325 [Candidatus Cloacimonetes bacterium]|nr:hypothetical protein [Candidatus Cloacimonadota bacterium]
MNRVTLFSIILMLCIPIFSNAQGCMEASSDEGVNVVGYLQSQFEYKFNDDDNESSFTFNRARMGLVGNIPYDFSYYVMFEFSPFQAGPYLLDGFITYSRLAPFAGISIGRFKSPLSLELNTPCQGLHTINRSLVVEELTFPSRDMGILINGHFKKLVKYALAFTNESISEDGFDDDANKTFAGRLVISPLEFISFGGSCKYGTTELSAEGDDPDSRIRYAGEFEFKYSNILVQAEYLQGKGFYKTGDTG